MTEITVQRGSEIGSHHMHSATGAGRGSSARVGGEASVAGVPPGNLTGGAVRPAGSFRNGHYAPWTSEDIALLRSVWPDAKILNSDLAELFGRSVFAVRVKAQTLRLGKRPKETAAGRPEYYARRRAEIAASQAECEAEQRRQQAEEWRRLQAARWDERAAHARELLRRGIQAETVAQAWRMQPATRAVADKDDDDDAPSKSLPPSPWRKVKAELVQRKCLRCRREFAAPGKFVRLCDYCRTRDEGML